MLVPLGSVPDPVAGPSEDINKHLNWIKAGNHVNQISDCYLLEKRRCCMSQGSQADSVAIGNRT